MFHPSKSRTRGCERFWGDGRVCSLRRLGLALAAWSQLLPSAAVERELAAVGRGVLRAF
jgi:hypothetical protein